MKNIVLDGSKFITKEEMHNILKKEFEFPDYYGKNLDALWDCLTGYIELPVNVEWRDFGESKKFLGNYAEEVLTVFRDAEEELIDEFKIILK